VSLKRVELDLVKLKHALAAPAAVICCKVQGARCKLHLTEILSAICLAACIYIYSDRTRLATSSLGMLAPLPVARQSGLLIQSLRRTSGALAKAIRNLSVRRHYDMRAVMYTCAGFVVNIHSMIGLRRVALHIISQAGSWVRTQYSTTEILSARKEKGTQQRASDPSAAQCRNRVAPQVTVQPVEGPSNHTCKVGIALPAADTLASTMELCESGRFDQFMKWR
jgi:hypothetical protein